MAQECINTIKEVVTDIKDHEALEILGLLEKKVKAAKSLKGAGATAENQADILAQASDEIINDLLTASVIQKRNAVFNIVAENKAYQHIQQFENQGLGLVSYLVGLNSNIKGSRASISAQSKSIFGKFVGGMLYDLENAKLIKHFNSKEYDRDIARALWSMDTDGNLKGIRSEAIEIAKIVKKYQDVAVHQQNSVGAWIKKLPGYITRQSHDQFKIRKAGFEKWKQVALKHIDPDQTFKELNPKEIDEFLNATYLALTSGTHLKARGGHAADDAAAFTGPSNLAKRISQERVLHFKSADDWYDYNRQFGTQGLSESVVFGLEHSARNIALMKNLGTNPEGMFNKIRKRLLDDNRDNYAATKKLRSNIIDAYYAEVDGSARIPVNQTMASGGAIVRAVNNMAKLGAATLSAITDIPFHAAELRYQGHGLLKGYSNAFNGVMKGRSGAERREIADLLGVGFEGMIGTILSRFGATDSLPGRMSKLQQGFFRLNLLSWWTDSQKTAAGLMMSKHMFMQKANPWDQLDPEMQRVFGLYNIDEAKWNVIRSLDYQDGHITPEAVRQLSDESVMQALGVVPKAATGLKFYKGDLTPTGQKPATGSSPGGFFKDKFGKEYFMKTEDDKVARNEILANRLYQLLGVRVLNKHLSNVGDKGKLGVVSDRVDMKQAGAAIGLEHNLKDDFVVHAWLANWDVLGTGFDNVQMIGGKATHIDEGGALLFRGMGEPKGSKFTKKVGELETLPSSSQGKYAFGDLTEDQIINGARRVAGVTDEEINILVKTFGPTQKKLQKELIDKLIARRDDIATRLGVTEKDKLPTAIDIKDLMKASTPKSHTHKIQQYKDDLEDALRMYFTDRVDFAVPTPGDREQAIMKQGTQPGTPLGEALRFIMQFKSFPVTVLTKPLGRELHGAGAKSLKEALLKGNGDIKGLSHLILGTTIFGYMALAAKDASKGREPRDPDDPKTWIAAFTQGGGLGIYGDFMFGEFNRFGRSFTATMAGPTFGQMDDIAELYSRFIRGEDTAARSVRFAMNNTPGINLFYTRAALDYFLLYNIQELVNPGYLSRLESRIKQHQGQKFYIPPSSVIKYGGGYR